MSEIDQVAAGIQAKKAAAAARREAHALRCREAELEEKLEGSRLDQINLEKEIAKVRATIAAKDGAAGA